MNEPTQIREDAVIRRMKQVFVVFVMIGGFFILAEHRVHVIAYLPWLLLAACPLMHVFMHHGHRGHPHHGSGDEPIRQSHAASASGYVTKAAPGDSGTPSASQQQGDRS
jgi:hypothetical protein